ncbi:MAG TPA: hypothetical protein VGH99_17595 [Pseudonocardia sp.]|jgi:hypothetical protein
MEAWDAAVRFLLVDNRAQALAESHPLREDGRCGRCRTSECSAAELAVEALAVIAARRRAEREADPQVDAARPRLCQ